MEKSLDSLMGSLEILDVRSNVCEIGEEHVDILEKHEDREEHNEREINLEEYMWCGIFWSKNINYKIYHSQ